ncbi:hypothetical protein AC477_02845 [miscellaneous Crenarchaeota group-1 archaeon SG8-32-1]|uniref:Uncharacterized protein n=1 Tax=miscellaneous Crenarchaeota group-1 archaeon SG8-32-1 TaxID=1685124 RepID=A0A0M0BVA5_9ARCH|nr:MAG: hypothetical protein AC477_02845 [miscellaneous Crenarchaeota group-1 archaeon SG8-32-1]
MRKKRKKSGKGSVYEREICKKLSLWWTDGVRDDIYWRTASSGGRATARKKMGKSTVGQYGDVQATDPIGKPLTDLCTIEIKRGYTSETFANLIERHQNPKVKECLYERFIKQATDEKIQARTPYWLLIVKRNAREPIVLMSYRFYRQLGYDFIPEARLTYHINEEDFNEVFVCLLEDFLVYVQPEDIKEIWKKITARKKKKKIRQ